MTMKSLFIIYDYQIFEMQRFGGISRYFCEIIKRISAQHKITVRYSINYYLTSWMLEKSLILLPRFIYKRYHSFFEKKNHEITKKLLKTGGPYLLHPTYYDPYFLDYIGENPYIITVHDMIHEKFPQYVTDANITIGHKKKVITRANRIIAISENTKKDIIEIFNINPQKIDVIYHSTSMKHFSGKHKLQIPERFLLFVGDRTPYKNFKRFMETFAQIHEQDRTLFAIYTGSKLKKDEQDMLIGMGIFEYTIHIKASDQALSELYSRALLFVYPSLYEGFGLPPLEAMSCATPVIASNLTSIPEVTENNASAIIRPEFIEINKFEDSEYHPFESSMEDAVVEDVSFRGNSFEVRALIDNISITGRYPLNASRLKKGDKVKVLIKKLYTIDENTTNILVNKALDDSELYYI